MKESNRSSSRSSSIRMAFCGLIAALSITLMLTGGIIPIATYCVPMAAGLLLLPVLLEFGKKTAWTTFLSVALLSILLDADKEAAFFYLFLGHYPLLKWELDRIKNKPIRIIVKLSLYSASITLLYVMLAFLFNMHAIVSEFGEIGAGFTLILLILFNVCMLLYDRLLFPVVFLYVNRIKPKQRLLKK